MEIKQGKELMLLPPGPGKCPICAENEHGSEMPHNRDSLYYQFWYHRQHGRMPTWADAANECTPEFKQTLKAFLVENDIAQAAIGDL